jgi:hypothetical protein
LILGAPPFEAVAVVVSLAEALVALSRDDSVAARTFPKRTLRLQPIEQQCPKQADRAPRAPNRNGLHQPPTPSILFERLIQRVFIPALAQIRWNGETPIPGLEKDVFQPVLLECRPKLSVLDGAVAAEQIRLGFDLSEP